MRRRAARRFAVPVLVALSGGVLAVSLAGCATTGTAPSPAKASAGAAAAAAAAGPRGPKVAVPAEIGISINLREGDAWKSRFVSTSEMKRTLAGADGKQAVKARTVGLEVVATQKVASVAGGKARIEVAELSSRILQDGTFVDAPFKRFNPPNPVSFTLDIDTGKADFAEMEKAYREWMAAVKTGPAGDILGKTFRLEAYVAQLEELYAKPFTRFAGRTLSKAPGAPAAKEFVQPFLGPGVALGPVPVETTSWFERFEAKGGVHALSAASRYDGAVSWTPGELADRLADFAAPAPAAFRSSGEVRGRHAATVDVRSGREVRSESHLRYTASASFEGGTLSEEIAGKSTLEPAD